MSATAIEHRNSIDSGNISSQTTLGVREIVELSVSPGITILKLK